MLVQSLSALLGSRRFAGQSAVPGMSVITDAHPRLDLDVRSGLQWEREDRTLEIRHFESYCLVCDRRDL